MLDGLRTLNQLLAPDTCRELSLYGLVPRLTALFSSGQNMPVKEVVRFLGTLKEAIYLLAPEHYLIYNQPRLILIWECKQAS